MRNYPMMRPGLLASTGLAIALAGAQPALAQDDPAPAPAAQEQDDIGLGEIVVTAQKRESTLQDTPVAISAFSGDDIEERGITDLSNLQAYVPNLNVGAEQDGVKISLRGIGLQGRPRSPIRASLSMSTISTSAAPRAATRPSSTSTGSKCCAGRRARSTAATPPAGWSTSSPRRRRARSRARSAPATARAT
ncbi:MAG: TonB-dependent receptor plug domain-containing protein [Sphingomonas sp.]